MVYGSPSSGQPSGWRDKVYWRNLRPITR